MKKFAAVVLSAAITVSLAACGRQSDRNAESSAGSTRADQTQAADSQTERNKESQSQVSGEDSDTLESRSQDTGSSASVGKTLVVYYSATGNTREVAEYIGEATGGELFELEPVKPYSSDDLNWRDENSRVTREHNNPDERDIELIASTVSDWESYENIFIGYPIWWGIAAWPVDGFIEANDFTDKTVIPFCTSSSSGFGESGELLKEAAGTGDWLTGERFSSSASESDVKVWVETLELKNSAGVTGAASGSVSGASGASKLGDGSVVYFISHISPEGWEKTVF